MQEKEGIGSKGAVVIYGYVDTINLINLLKLPGIFY